MQRDYKDIYCLTRGTCSSCTHEAQFPWPRKYTRDGSETLFSPTDRRIENGARPQATEK
jgi:hypothetical protein